MFCTYVTGPKGAELRGPFATKAEAEAEASRSVNGFLSVCSVHSLSEPLPFTVSNKGERA